MPVSSYEDLDYVLVKIIRIHIALNKSLVNDYGKNLQLSVLMILRIKLSKLLLLHENSDNNEMLVLEFGRLVAQLTVYAPAMR